VVDPEAKAKKGIGPGVLRLSVGLESPQDLWADLEQALARALAQADTHRVVAALAAKA
jgi:cystathionine beta-lyase/cystathionine gamma-synthase